MTQTCILIPVYDHEHALPILLARLKPHGLHCVMVDDGSGPSCRDALIQLQQQESAWVSLVQHKFNQGKGAAILTGLREAQRRGFSHALQIDADGQHDVGDIPRFLEAIQAQPEAVIAGVPIYDASVPKGRLYGRYLTHIWVWINTLSTAIQDSMCGFRAYPITPILALTDKVKLGQRMEFDTEILVRWYWRGGSIVNLPTRVTYPLDGVSHFDLLRDNVLIAGMHARMFFGMLPRIPRLLIRHWRKT